MSEEYITIGEIVNTQGTKGEVRVFPHTDFPDRFNDLAVVSVYHRNQRVTMHIESARPHKKFMVISLREVADMDAAEKLKGALLQITEDQLVPLPEGSYYIFEIEGMEVFDVLGNCLGKVAQVLKTGANDVYVVKSEEGKEILIPALKTVVKEIDKLSKKMVVELPEGLMD